MNIFIKITLQLRDKNMIFDTEKLVEEKKFKNRLSPFYSKNGKSLSVSSNI